MFALGTIDFSVVWQPPVGSGVADSRLAEVSFSARGRDVAVETVVSRRTRRAFALLLEVGLSRISQRLAAARRGMSHHAD